MGRWAPDARLKLEQAALELFVEQGFAATTVPQITARAGLTTRTFHRHFADKREVLFAGGDDLPALAARLIGEAPSALGPNGVIERALRSLAEEVFTGPADAVRRRRAIIASDEGLRERELRKLSALTDAAARAFVRRGLPELSAAVAARKAVAVFEVALHRWADGDAETFLAAAEETLRAFAALDATHG